MGIIQRQGIQDSIATYTGVALGAVNTLFIYPRFLKEEELGLFQFMISAGMILALFVAFGSYDLATRYFPLFRTDDRRHHGFLFILLMIPVAGFLLLLVLTFVFRNAITGYFGDKDPLIQQFWPWLLPLVFFLGLNYVLVNFTKNFFRIVVPTILENIFVKLCTGLISVMLFFSWLHLKGFVSAIVLTYGAVTLGLIAYLLVLGQWRLRPDWKFWRPGLAKEMSRFAFYSMLGGLSAGFLTWLDRVMISFLMEEDALKSVGVFSIAAYIGTVVDVPRRSLEKIAAPITADAFQRGDMGHIAMLYRKSSINQFIVGLFLFLLIWHNLDDLFILMPNGERYAGGKSIVFILGLAMLLNMAAGINHQILTFSRYYRLNFFLLLALAGLNVVFNYLLIRTFGFGIFGAALATLASVLIFNVAKLLIIYRKLRIQPFTRSTLGVLAIGSAIFLAFSFFPFSFHPLIAIPVKSALIAMLFAWPVLHWRLSPDLNDLFHRFMGRLGF